MFPQTLLIDADDTLWENNIYFERAIARFISFLNHHEFSPAQVREVLNDVERECIVTHGYGLHSFAHALVRTFERLTVKPVTPELHAADSQLRPYDCGSSRELLPEVPETLQYLCRRHRLILMTKGAVAEQSGKVERSGLKEYFAAIESSRRKIRRRTRAYRKVRTGARFDLDGWQQSEVRHQSRPGGWTARGIRPSRRHLDSRARGITRGPRINAAIVGRFAELREHF